jgi:ribosomal protein S13
MLCEAEGQERQCALRTFGSHGRLVRGCVRSALQVKDVKETYLQKVTSYIEEHFTTGDALKRQIRENVVREVRQDASCGRSIVSKLRLSQGTRPPCMAHAGRARHVRSQILPAYTAQACRLPHVALTQVTIGTRRGQRHSLGLPVGSQHTRNNAVTALKRKTLLLFDTSRR